VTALDWIIVGVTVLMAALGFRQGFLVGALSIAGFVAGALLGTRVLPKLVPDGAASPYAPLLGLVGALFGGLILSTGLSGVGAALRHRLGRVAPPGARAVDGLLGAVLSAALALAIAWVAGSVALQTPGARTLRRDVQRSAILQRLNDALPPSGPLLHALARFDPVPQIAGPQADVPAPRAAIARDPEVRRAAASVVRVLGTACGLGVTGSGWVAADGLVVTNAHVVAGQHDTTVQLRGEGPRLNARAVAFSARDDVAVLAVDGLQAPVLTLERDPEVATSAAILGFPLNGPYDVRAGRLGQTRSVLSPDALGRGPVRRSVTSFRGTVRPGNSGGPMVDGRGRVVTTVFAATRGGSTRGGYGVPDAAVASVLARARRDRGVSTGPCAS
jgi:S1-C subfamily serine protease